MNGAGDTNEERGSDELLAAEHVLGVLPAAERQAASVRIETDRAFAEAVERWEAHFSPFAAAYREEEPPPGVKAALDRRLFASTAAAGEALPGRAGLWRNLAFWRGLAAAATAGLAFSVGVSIFAPFGPGEAPRLVASLQGQGSDVRFVALYDEARHQVALSHLSGDTGAERDFELWMIEGGNPPVSVGVIPAGPTIRITLSREAQEKLAAGGVLAISLEPAGGSPTGQPTGPVVASGDLRDI